MRIHRLARTGSTQDELERLAEAGAPAGTVVVAETQEAGRGSRGRRWASPPGGLWMSVLARPAGPDAAEVASVRAGLAVIGALRATLGALPLALKWPNDLLLDGRKVGGILCESRWHGAALAWVAVGVGLNVQNAPPADARVPATRLADWAPAARPEALVEPVARALAVLESRRGPLAADELAAFAAVDALRGTTVLAPERGVALGLRADGALRLRRADGSEAVLRHGPVEWAPATTSSRD